jgi:hypothetical protein
MDEAEKVLERLRRIRELDEGAAAPSRLLDELRELVGEAESWARAEGDARARAAVLRLGEAFDRVRPDGGDESGAQESRAQESEVTRRRVTVH